MRVLKTNVLVMMDKAEEITEGGIIIPDKAQDTAWSGEVIAVGSEVKEIKVSDHVFIGKYAGVSMVHNDKPCVLLREEDILAVIE